MELTHLEIQELLGVYALDAVDAEEADLVEVHLRDCPRCRAEVADHREVAASLAQVGSTAPPGVWARIAGNLEEPPPQLDMARVVSMSGRRPRRSIPLRMAAAVAAAAAAVIAILGVQVRHLDGRTDELAAALQEKGLDEAVRAALLDTSARRVDLRSNDGVTIVQAVVRDNGDAFLVGDNLPKLPDSQTYQLWAVTGDRAVSVGVLGSDPGVAAFKVASPGVSVLALTAEEAGGVVSSTRTPVVQGLLPVV
ncbi:MAG TPA: anti-sigma factor [Acidimicrobiales bacterium]|nr:anti-sigma factor [Acidimicrobiales bacterium]